jgi:NADH-quinone oxidoreductase subunit G
LSDRDRYSHQGLSAADRAVKPLLKRNGAWVEAGWDEALAFVAGRLKSTAPEQVSALAHPATSCEEGYLFAKLISALGIANLDHRVRQLDLSDGAVAEPFARSVVDIEKSDAILLIGSDLRQELPLVNHRVRKAWKHGAKVYAINPLDFDFNFDLAGKSIAAPGALLDAVLKIARVASDDANASQSEELAQAIAGIAADDAARATYSALKQAKAATVIFGDSAVAHPQAAWLRAAAQLVAKSTHSDFNEIPAGANAIGLAHVGVLPGKGGLDAAAQIAQLRSTYVLYGLEQLDFADSATTARALRGAECVIAFSAYASASLREVAQVILPIGLLPEIDATLINVDGIEQTVAAAAKLPGEARPGWRVLRALGAQLDLPGFDFVKISEVRSAIDVSIATKSTMRHGGKLERQPPAPVGLTRISTVPIYRTDAVLRRSAALQAHPLTGTPAIGLHPEDALALGLAQDAQARVSGGDGEAILPVVIGRMVPRGGAWIESGWAETSGLPPAGSAITVTRAGS